MDYETGKRLDLILEIVAKLEEDVNLLKKAANIPDKKVKNGKT